MNESETILGVFQRKQSVPEAPPAPGAAEGLGVFDLILFLFISLVIVTRQVEFHSLISYGSVLLFLAGYFVIKRRDKTPYRLPHPLITAVVTAYLVCVLISTLFSLFSFMGYQQLIREILFFAVMFFLHDSIKTRRQWTVVVKAIIFSGVFTAFTVVVSALRSVTIGATSQDIERLTGIFYNPSATGLVLSVSYPVTLGYLQWRKAIGRPRAGVMIWWFNVLALVSATLTISRSTLLSIGFSLVALNIGFLWRHRFKLTMATGALVAAGLLLTPSSDTLEKLATVSRVENGLSGRDFLWNRAWEIFLEHPVIGTGPSTFRYHSLAPDSKGLNRETVNRVIEDYYADENAIEILYPGSFGGIIGNSAHNIWLDTAANMGMVGILSLLSMFLSFGLLGRRLTSRLRIRKDLPYFWVVRGCFVGVIAFFLRTQFEPGGLLKGALSESLLFWTTILLVISVYKYPKGFCAPGDQL